MTAAPLAYLYNPRKLAYLNMDEEQEQVEEEEEAARQKDVFIQTDTVSCSLQRHNYLN